MCDPFNQYKCGHHAVTLHLLSTDEDTVNKSTLETKTKTETYAYN